MTKAGERHHMLFHTIESLREQVTAYKAIVNQILAVVLDTPELEADYAHPPPVELLPPLGEIHAGRIQDWWLRVMEGYEKPDRPKHGDACETGAACFSCGVCGDCGRYVGGGE